MMHISTSYGDRYNINKRGEIVRENYAFSSNWKLIGLLPTNCSNFCHLIPFARITPEWVKSHFLSWKNGNPHYTVVELDHGSTKVWGNTKVHGIRSLWFD